MDKPTDKPAESPANKNPWNTDIWRDDTAPFLGFEDLLGSGDNSLLRGDLADNNEWCAPERPPSIASSVPLDTDFGWSELEDFMKKDTRANFGVDLDELSLDPTESSEVLSDWSSQSGGAVTWDDFGGHRSRQRMRRSLSSAPSDILQDSCTKSWSGDEQLRTVETLTEAISHQLGLREQLDVIRIIDPTASFNLSADQEFPVDLRQLDDRKLREIAEYVRKSSTATPTVGKNTKAASSTSSRKKSQGRQGDNHRSISERSSSVSSTPSARSKRGRRKRHRQQLQETTVEWQQQKKQQKQKLKEKRSGLFCHEERLILTSVTPATSSSAPSSLLAADEPEEEEVNILD